MKNKILIVDDVELNREILREILQEEYEIAEAESGKTALAALEREKEEICAILLDLVMPEMDGFAVMEELKARKIMGKIPVLIISGERSPEVEKRCFECGVSDFIGRPFNAVLVKMRVRNIVNQFIYKNRLEEKVQEQTVVLRKAYETLKVQAQKLKKRNQDIIEMLGTIVEYRNVESGEHIRRVEGYTRILAQYFLEHYPEYGLTEERIELIVSASALHDLGKIAIPDRILLKPGRLTEDEYDYMKSHTICGCEIFEAIKTEWEADMRQVSLEIIRHHHERYDGKGYPDGISGDEIPVSAQLVSLADVYDALVNERCYKDKYTKEEAFHMIINGECGMFSPKLLDALCNVRKEFEKMADMAQN